MANMVILGTTELDVFPICLGGNVFGWTADERAEHKLAVLPYFALAMGF